MLFIVCFSIESAAQDCNCTILPVTRGCEKKCGLYYSANGSVEQMVDKLKIDRATAIKISKLPDRKTFRDLSDFKAVLPEPDFRELERKYNSFVTTSTVIQYNESGNNFNGGQTVQNQIIGNPFIYNYNVDSVKFAIAKINRQRRTDLSNFYLEGQDILEQIAKNSFNQDLQDRINEWHRRTYTHLNSIELSFAVRFKFPINDNVISYNIPVQQNENWYKTIKEKLRILFDLISELKSDFYN